MAAGYALAQSFLGQVQRAGSLKSQVQRAGSLKRQKSSQIRVTRSTSSSRNSNRKEPTPYIEVDDDIDGLESSTSAYAIRELMQMSVPKKAASGAGMYLEPSRDLCSPLKSPTTPMSAQLSMASTAASDGLSPTTMSSSRSMNVVSTFSQGSRRRGCARPMPKVELDIEGIEAIHNPQGPKDKESHTRTTVKL
eukprot:CAMPEP_0178417204 /NCGR_PEP_ID=MMETSP0689_2-20121128/24454_1 /TAXON_ID=160604 /ORGANISM="Amphidinium massartii, Strain CS-259" /LENGTH=192 /DNA_ID=CAMNT_0020038563 /DNA_START=1 /DNA_END=579 /DNA_ORIENTATION=+